MGFVPPLATIALIDYAMAADLLMNMEYRLEKLMQFSKKSIDYIHTHWGVPEPYNKAVFTVLSIISIILSKKIFGSLLSRSSKG